jgi:hypothetical protein
MHDMVNLYSEIMSNENSGIFSMIERIIEGRTVVKKDTPEMERWQAIVKLARMFTPR